MKLKLKNKQTSQNKIKLFWEKFNYWQKGIVIGFNFGILLFILIRLFEYFSQYLLDPPNNYLHDSIDTSLLFLGNAGKFFFLELFSICEFEKGLCNTFLPYLMIPITYMLFGLIIGLILFYIHKKHQLNKLSKGKYYALLSFVTISFLIVIDFIMSFPYSLYSLIFRFAFLGYLIISGIFTAYFYILGWSYEFMEKKKWWDLKGKIIYSIIFIIIFIVMWMYISTLMILIFFPAV